MTAKTLHHPVSVTNPASPSRDADHGPVPVDFDTLLSQAANESDTRLMLTSIGMDVLLARAGGRDLADAHAAVAAAVENARGASADALAPQSITKGLKTHMTPNSPADVLTMAAQIVRERGWMKGRLVGTNGAVCARQAVFLAAGGTDGQRGYDAAVGDRQMAAEALLLDRIREEFDNRYGDVTMWNDSTDTDRAGLFRLLF